MSTLQTTAALVAAACLTPILSAQIDLEHGFQKSVFSAAPGGSFVGGLDSLQNGNLAVFDGVSVVELDGATGALVRTLFTPPTPVFGSFVKSDPGGSYLLFGESSNHEVWKLPLDGSAASLVASVPYNFDCVFLAADLALISRGEATFTTTFIDQLDVNTGAIDRIAEVDGPSGPLAIDVAGNLYYGINSGSWPVPPGSGEVVYWTPAQIASAQGPAHLLEGDSQSFASGLDAVTDMLFDNHGDLLVSDSTFGTLSEYRTDGQRRGLIGQEQTFNGITYLALLDGGQPGGAVFGPFQPEAGGTLAALSTDWSSYSDVSLIRPERAAFHATPGNPIPAGPFSVELREGPPLGTLFVFAAAGSSLPEDPLVRQGVPFFFGLDAATLQLIGVVPLDAAGDLVINGNYGGGLNAAVFFQGALLDAASQSQGTTQVLELDFQ
jgi:hypothetical protein